MTIKDIFETHWQKQEYTQAIQAMYAIYDDVNSPEQERNQANDLANYLERSLIRFTSYAQETLKNNPGEARKHLDKIPRPLPLEQVPWWESYEPLQQLLKRLPENEPDTQKAPPRASQEKTDGSGEEPSPDPKQERIPYLLQQLQGPELKLPDECAILLELIELGAEKDNDDQPLALRLKVAQADHEQRFGDAQKAYALYLKAQADLRGFRPAARAAALLERARAGLLRDWEEKVLPGQLKAIRGQISRGALEEAAQACKALLEVRDHPDVRALQAEIEAARREQQEAKQSVQVLLEQIEQALADHNLSRAEQFVQQVGDLPEAKKLKQEVRQRRREFEKLVGDAQEKAQKLAFAEAVELYDRALELDRANDAALAAQGQANADKNILARLDNMLAEANSFLANREQRKLSALYQEIVAYDQNSNWRQQQIAQLRSVVENLENDFERYQDTFHEDVDKGEIHWPDEVERRAIDAYKGDGDRDKIKQYVDREVGRFLEKHYIFLTGESNTVDRRKLNELADSLARLREIQKHWQDFLNKPERLATHTTSGSLATTTELAATLVAYLPVYEEAETRLAQIDAALAGIDDARKKGEGHQAALQQATACLDQRPDKNNSVYDLIDERYKELQAQYDQLKRIYEVGNSSALADVEMYLKMGKFAKARKILNSLPVGELPAEAQGRWNKLNPDVIACETLLTAFKKAERHWHAGEWDEARTAFGRVAAIFKTLSPELQNDDYAPVSFLNRSSGRMKVLVDNNQNSEVIKLGGQLIELTGRPLNQANLTQLQKLRDSSYFAWISNGDNKYLYGLYTDLSAREIRRENLLLFLRDNLDESAKKLFRSVKKKDPDYAELFTFLQRYNNLGPGLEEVDKLLAKAYQEEDISKVLRKLEEASGHVVDIDTLQLANSAGERAKNKKRLVYSMLTSIRSVETKLKTVQSHISRQEYSQACQKLKEVWGDTPREFKAFREASQKEQNRLNNLAHVQQPYLDAIQKASTLTATKTLTLDNLDNAKAYLGQARDYLEQIIGKPDDTTEAKDDAGQVAGRLDDLLLQQAEQAWLAALEGQVKAAWGASNYTDLEALLKLGEGRESETLADYRRLNGRHTALKELDKQLGEAKLEEADKAYGSLTGLTDQGNPSEAAETATWERRVAALRLTQEGVALLAQAGATAAQLDELIAKLEAALKDAWPDGTVAMETLEKLRQQSAVAAAREALQRGDLQAAVKEYGKAGAQHADAEKAQAFQDLVKWQTDARKAFQDGDMKKAVDELKNCLSQGDPSILERWDAFTDLKAQVEARLIKDGDQANTGEAYARALENYELLHQLQSDDTRHADLLKKLRLKLQGLMNEKDTLDGQGYRADPRELRSLLNRLSDALLWGIPEPETKWIPDVQTRFAQRVEEIETAEKHILIAWDLLERAKDGEETALFDAVYEELRPVQPYAERQSYQEIRKEAGVWSRAFNKIHTALREYQKAGKQDFQSKAPVAQAIKDFDPGAEPKLQITKTALKSIG